MIRARINVLPNEKYLVGREQANVINLRENLDVPMPSSGRKVAAKPSEGVRGTINLKLYRRGRLWIYYKIRLRQNTKLFVPRTPSVTS